VWICAHCADAPEAAVACQVTNSKNADVAAYVIDQSRPGGVFAV